MGSVCRWEGTHLSPTSVIKPLAPDVSQGLPSLSPGQQLHPWGRLVHGAVFPPPFCLGFSCILKPTGGDAETSPSPERPLSGPEHSQVDGWFCLSKASLSRALGWLITQHSQPRLPRGPLPAHTPCAVGLVGQLVPVCEGPECHTLQELWCGLVETLRTLSKQAPSSSSGKRAPTVALLSFCQGSRWRASQVIQ